MFTRNFFIASFALPVLTPTIVFLLFAITKGVTSETVFGALLQQLTSLKPNLIGSGLAGLFPVLLLWLALKISARFIADPLKRSYMGWSGLLTIAGVLVFVNLEYWPGYFPERGFRGFPHGLEFVIGPFIFAPIAMLAGMVTGWLLARVRRQAEAAP